MQFVFILKQLYNFIMQLLYFYCNFDIIYLVQLNPVFTSLVITKTVFFF